MNTYPRKDQHHAATYWTGEPGADGTYVTGRRSWTGARTRYWQATCTCTPYGAVGPTRYGDDALDRVESDAYEHAASHVLRPADANAPADVPSNAPYAGDDTKYRTPRNGGRCPGCGLVMSVREGAEQGRCNECLTGPSLTAPGYGW